MLQDLLHDIVLGHEGEHDPAAAARTDEHVFAKDAQEKLCPGDAGGLTARRGLRWRWCGIRSRTRPWRALLWARDDLTLRQADAGPNTPCYAEQSIMRSAAHCRPRRRCWVALRRLRIMSSTAAGCGWAAVTT